jgi:hypothetical protein
VLFPPPDSPRPRVDALAPDGLAVIAFSFAEPIDARLELRASPGVLSCRPVSVPTGQYAFNCTLDAGTNLESLVSMTVRVADGVGNEATSVLTLVPPLRVDSVRPTFTPDAGLTLLRVPVAVGPYARTVTGAPGVAEPNVLIQAYETPAAVFETGRGFAGDAGELAIDVGPGDRRFAAIRACDSAGNLSDTIVVKDVEFRAAPGPRDSVTAVVMGAASPRHDRPELVPLAGSVVVHSDDAGVLITGQSTWVRRGVQWPAPSGTVDPSLAFDEGTATVVAQAATSVHFYSGRDFFRNIIVPTPRGNAAMAYDRRRGVIVI